MEGKQVTWNKPVEDVGNSLFISTSSRGLSQTRHHMTQLPWGMRAEEVGHSTGIAEVMGSITFNPEFFRWPFIPG